MEAVRKALTFIITFWCQSEEGNDCMDLACFIFSVIAWI